MKMEELGGSFILGRRHLEEILVVIVSLDDFGFAWCVPSLRFLGFGAKHGLQKFLPVGTSRSGSLRRRSVSWWRHRDVGTLFTAFPTLTTDLRSRSWQRILHFLLVFLLLALPTRSTQIAATVCQCRRVVGFLGLLAAQKLVSFFLSELVQTRFARGCSTIATRLWPFQQPPWLLDVGAVEVGLSLGLWHFSAHLLGVRVSLVGKTFAEMSPFESERNWIRKNDNTNLFIII